MSAAFPFQPVILIDLMLFYSFWNYHGTACNVTCGSMLLVALSSFTMKIFWLEKNFVEWFKRCKDSSNSYLWGANVIAFTLDVEMDLLKPVIYLVFLLNLSQSQWTHKRWGQNVWKFTRIHVMLSIRSKRWTCPRMMRLPSIMCIYYPSVFRGYFPLFVTYKNAWHFTFSRVCILFGQKISKILKLGLD